MHPRSSLSASELRNNGASPTPLWQPLEQQDVLSLPDSLYTVTSSPRRGASDVCPRPINQGGKLQLGVLEPFTLRWQEKPDEGAWLLENSISIDSIEPLNLRGNFYDTLLGTHVREGRVVVKRLRYRGRGESDDEALAQDFKREADIWMSLRHKGIGKCLGTFTLNGNICLVSMFNQNGTLFDLVRSKRHIGQQRLRLIHELAEALAYLHSSGIVHGDVKAQNVFLSDDLHVQLCDFGLAKVAETYTTTRFQSAGSFRWQSPELWDNEPKTFKSDVYAFAMTMVEMLTGQTPFADLTHDPAVMMAVTGKNIRPAKAPLTSPDGISYSTPWDVAEQGWSRDASKRITMAEAAELLRAAL